MITLRCNIIYAGSSPLFRFDSMTEAMVYMMQLGYHGSIGAKRGEFTFSR